MGQDSKIEWTTHTWNPWIGCTRVSPGCDHCYAEALAKRYGWAEWGVGKPRHRTSDANWRKPLQWNRAAATSRPRVFPSLCDPFDNEVPTGWRYDLWAMIEFTPGLDWLLLTKRIGNWKMVPVHWHRHFPDNVWLGISVVNQEEADRDIPKLLAVPARVRFLSCEPLLGPLWLTPHLEAGVPTRPNWVIVGGESGPGARPFNTTWARSIVEQCRAAGVACFVKQLGAHVIQGGERRIKRDKKGGDMSEWPHEIRVREFPPLTNSQRVEP